MLGGSKRAVGAGGLPRSGADGLTAEQVLSGENGDIHYSYYLPESYDGSR